MRVFVLCAVLVACCYAKDFQLHSEKSFPMPFVDKNYVKTVNECAAVCRGKFSYFGIGREGTSSCRDDKGCTCLCGHGKMFGQSATYDTYEFKIDYKLHQEKSYPMPFANKGYVKSVDDCAGICRGNFPYFGIGRKGSSSCRDDKGCWCICGHGRSNPGSPTFDTYKFEKDEPISSPPKTTAPPQTAVPTGPATPAPPAPVCGKPAIQSSRVIGGDTAVPHSWPWQILLLKSGRPMCGGSLVSPKFVITAAHCVSRSRHRPASFSVRVGEHNKASDSDDHEATHQVKRITVHYKYKRLNNDIAILELEKPVLMNKWVSPVCLPNKDVPVGTECYITGWGKTRHPGTMTSILQQARIPVVTNDVCYKKNNKILNIPISSAMVCSGDGGESNKSGCHGDSGGPFVCKINGVWELHGAVSWGSPRCKSTETYTVFARVNYFRKWIDGVMNSA